jgi:cytochrome c oxidase subunit 2
MSGFKTALLFLTAACAGSPALADWQLNLPRGASLTSREVYGLHMLILGICAVIAVIVYAAMIYAIVTFRKTKGAEAARFHHNTRAEVVWTVIPAAILVAMAVPSAETLIRIEDTRASELTIKVTGYQWKWHYDYIDHRLSFFSTLDPDSNAARRLRSGRDPFGIDNYLLNVDQAVVVPVDTKVRLLVTAADVLHSWWVPELAVKKDAVPGFINEAWFTATDVGIYRGQCAELCGMDHGFMPIVVDVRTREDFDAWLAERGEGALTRAN